MNKKNIVRASASSLALLWVSSCAQFSAPPLCSSDITPIHAIQGTTVASPRVGEQLTTRGIVTATWQGEQQLGGYFIQSTADDQDNDPATSEGLFIATGDSPAQIAVGDLVYVTGDVAEAQQLTQLSQLQNPQAYAVCASGLTVPETPLQLPVANLAVFEALEGMLVKLTQELTVNGHYQLLRHGQFDVAPERLYTPTQHVQPGQQARERERANRHARLVIDDNRAPNPTTINVPAPALSAGNSLRSGDKIAPVSGILSAYNNSYRLQPTSPITVVNANPRPQPPAAPATNTVRVAAFNVLNYFNGNGADKTFPTARGAKTQADFTRQHAKIIAALSQLNADIIGLMEIENDGYSKYSAIDELTTALAAATGQPWTFVRAAEHKFGSDAITNGLIYRSDKVTPQGQPLTINQAPFGQRSRLPLIQRFAPSNTVENLVVAVNHFKSKGSCPKSSENPNADQKDGQACWNQARTESAHLLADFLDSHNDLKRHDYRVVMGDFNAYAQEDPIQVLLKRGYYNRIDYFNPQAYSYVYDAQAGSLDHLLVSASLTARVVNQAIWSINADEPTLLQYNNAGTNSTWYAPSPYRASDHDPVFADIQF